MATTALTCAWVIGQPQYNKITSLSVVSGALVCFGLLVRYRSAVSKAFAITLACVALCVCVALPPRGSHDVYSYAAYGRLVSQYNQSPYAHAPNEHLDDPLVKKVPQGWQHVKSVYGPLFTGISAGLVDLTGSSTTGARLGQQLLEAVAVLSAVALVTRHRPKAHPWLLVGLNPAVLVIVNGGHNDLLMGVLVLYSTLLLSKQRVMAAGLAIGAAILIKATALLAAIALALWLMKRVRGTAVTYLVTAAVVVASAYALAGGMDALKPLADNGGYTSRASLLTLPRHLFGHLSADIVGVVLFITLIMTLCLKKRDSIEADESVALANSALIFSSPYVLPWYCGWSLPVAALCEGTFGSAVALIQSGLLLAAYAVPAGVATGSIAGTVSICALPVSLLAALVLKRKYADTGRLSSTE